MTMTAIEHEAQMRSLGGLTGSIRPNYGYYRQPNGWIKPAVMTPMEELKYRREGWEPLPRYGRFDMGTGYAADHPLELLFMLGGAAELCEDQIRQQGLYMNPPLVPTCRQALTQQHRKHSPACWVGAKPVHFPQVANMKDLGPFLCRFCDRKSATIEGRDQHEGVMHQEEKGNIQMGETLAASLTEGMGKPGATAEVKAIVDVLTELTKKLTDSQREVPAKKVAKVGVPDWHIKEKPEHSPQSGA